MRVGFVSFLLLWSGIGLACTRGVASQALPWHHGLDFTQIEKELSEGEIESITPISEHLRNLGRNHHGDSEGYYVALKSGIAGIAKPESIPWGTSGEIGAYRVARLLKSKLIAPTVKRCFAQLGRCGSFQYYVQTPFDLTREAQHETARKLLSRKNKSDLILLQFVLGRWDIHSGNLLVDASGEPVLIDCADILDLQHIQYGDHPYLRRGKYRTEVDETKPFPFDNPRKLIRPSWDELQSTLGSYLDTEKLQKIFKKLGRGAYLDDTLRYIVHQGEFWFYQGLTWRKPLYTADYSRETL